MIDPKTGFLEEESHDVQNADTPSTVTVKARWQERNTQDWLNVYQKYMKEKWKRQPQPMCLPPRLSRDGKISKSGIKVKRKKADDGIYLEIDDSDIETGDEREICPNFKVTKKRTAQKNTRGSECETILLSCSDEDDDQHATEQPYVKSKHVKKYTNKTFLDNLRYNTLTILENSNICLFKWKKKLFRCYFCPKRFDEMSTVRNHVKVDHSRYRQIAKKIAKDKFLDADITNLECTLCFQVLNSLDALQNHLIEHGVKFKDNGTLLVPYSLCSERGGVCQICDKEFEEKCHLKRHMSEHFSFFTCNECEKSFKDASLLKKHHFVVHGRRRFQFCDNYPSVQSNFDCSDIESDMRFKCNHCGETFKYGYRKLQHLIEKHGRDSKLFQCEFCPKIFITVHWLTKHMNLVHREQLYS